MFCCCTCIIRVIDKDEGSLEGGASKIEVQNLEATFGTSGRVGRGRERTVATMLILRRFYGLSAVLEVETYHLLVMARA